MLYQGPDTPVLWPSVSSCCPTVSASWSYQWPLHQFNMVNHVGEKKNKKHLVVQPNVKKEAAPVICWRGIHDSTHFLFFKDIYDITTFWYGGLFLLIQAQKVWASWLKSLSCVQWQGKQVSFCSSKFVDVRLVCLGCNKETLHSVLTISRLTMMDPLDSTLDHYHQTPDEGMSFVRMVSFQQWSGTLRIYYKWF